MKALDFNYKKLRVAQDLNKNVLEAIGLMLLKKHKNGIFEMPGETAIAAYLNEQAEKRLIPHYLLKGEYGDIYLFDNDTVLREMNIIEVEAKKTPDVIPIFVQDEKVEFEDNVPFEISKIDNLFKLPESLFNSGTCIYFLCRNSKVVYVGQAENVHQRLVDHIKTKSFDSVFYLRVPYSSMNRVEHALISYLKPEYNQTALRETTKSLSLAKAILKEDGVMLNV